MVEIMPPKRQAYLLLLYQIFTLKWEYLICLRPSRVDNLNLTGERAIHKRSSQRMADLYRLEVTCSSTSKLDKVRHHLIFKQPSLGRRKILRLKKEKKSLLKRRSMKRKKCRLNRASLPI